MFHPSNCCRLCINFCNDHQSLYCADGRKSKVYQLMEKYFTPRFLNMERGRHLHVICMECWRHISDFQTFQLSVLLAQNKLVQADQQSAAILSTSADQQQLNKATVIANPASGSTLSNYDSNVSLIKEEFLSASEDEQSCTPITVRTDVTSCCNESNSASVATTASTSSRTNSDVFINNETNQRPESVVKTETAIGNSQQESDLINNLLESIEADMSSSNGSDFKLQTYQQSVSKVIPEVEDQAQENSRNNNLPVSIGVISNVDEDYWKSDSSDEEFEDPIGVFIGGEFNNETTETSKYESLRNAQCNSFLSTSNISSCSYSHLQKTKTSKLDIKHPKTVEEFDDFIARWRPNLECVICTESCSRFTQLLEHFNEQHPYEECHIRCCQLKLHHRYEIEQHIHYHQGTRTFKCDACLKCFTTKTSLNRHLRTIHSKQPKDAFKCPVCSRCYSSKDILQVHIKYAKHKTKKATETMRYTCSECEKDFSDKCVLGRHKKLAHLNPAKMNKCTICDKAYKNPQDLREHMGAHTENSKDTCPYCPKIYRNVREMRRHIKRHHSNDRGEETTTNSGVLDPQKFGIMQGWF